MAAVAEELDSAALDASANQPESETGNAAAQPPPAGLHKQAKLPLSRVKTLMKADPDVSLASQESVFIISKATELFIETIAKDAFIYAQRGKRKTLQRKDLATQSRNNPLHEYSQTDNLTDQITAQDHQTMDNRTSWEKDNAIDAIDEFAFLEGTLD
uniref:Transcription factor CBF/NF-Y/archaeal histone domain-containing protein n=1 Tax=Leptobrachium leishanense TaxID=445787 RepID=A0A8C5LMP4_9ANUR